VREKVCGKDERSEGRGGMNAGMEEDSEGGRQVRRTGGTEGRSEGDRGEEERARELAHACARGKEMGQREST
jgi:hypothetical protein